MTFSDLANVMLRAGVEEGMELASGLDFVQLSTFTGTSGTATQRERWPEPAVIDAGAIRVATSVTFWAHDFFTMSLRGNELRRTVTTTTTTTTHHDDRPGLARS